jgi:hypothetical protein
VKKVDVIVNVTWNFKNLDLETKVFEVISQTIQKVEGEKKKVCKKEMIGER